MECEGSDVEVGRLESVDEDFKEGSIVGSIVVVGSPVGPIDGSISTLPNIPHANTI